MAKNTTNTNVNGKESLNSRTAAPGRAEAATSRTETVKDTKSSGSRRGRRRQHTSTSTATAAPSNVTTMNSSVLVSPSDSAAMAAFGNRTTTPGQDNFISAFTAIERSPLAEDTPVTLSASSLAKRTSNAMVIEIEPLFGTVNTSGIGLWANPIRLAAANLKQFIDTSYGTVTRYDAQDLAAYLGAVSAAFPLIAEIKRDLRLAQTYIQDQYPQFVPRGLFAALGICDGEEHFANGEGAAYTALHMRSFIDRLNQIITAFNRLPMPPELSIFGYNDDLVSSIFMDSPDIQTAQLYAFKLHNVWLYMEDVNTDLGPFLKRWRTGPMSVDRKLYYLSELVERLGSLRTSSNAMLQNLFNAYGSKDMIEVPLLDYDAAGGVPFVYNEQVGMMIENMVICPYDWVTVSNFQTIHNPSNINQHVWINGPIGAACYFNLPLQFHKAPDLVTKEDIGWALRLHPSFLKQEKFTAYTDDHPTGTEMSHVTCDGYSGFALARSCTVYHLSDSAEIVGTSFTRYLASHSRTWPQLLDFHFRPLLLNYTATGSESTGFEYTLDYYTADRDVEVTYRLEDLAMHWSYLTQTVWASNLNRSTTGTRKGS